MLEAWTRKRDVKDGNGNPTGARESAIERLYNRMARKYLTKWTHSFKTEQDIRDWALDWSQDFARHGVSPQMVLAAIERCNTEYVDWPPSCPQFIAMCRPVIDYEQAFRDAVQQMRRRRTNEDFWPHPAIYWAAVDFGLYELRTVSYGQAAARWKRLLDKRLQSECLDVPKYVPQIAAPARNADGEAIPLAEARAAALKAAMGLHETKPSRELAIAQARAILARHAAGEVMYVYYVEHAKETLARLEVSDPGSGPACTNPMESNHVAPENP